METLVKLMRDEEGATMAEYALLLGLVTVAIATVIATFRGQLAAQFTRAGTALTPQ
jgi:pilus assembly protein Flp/PilA